MWLVLLLYASTVRAQQCSDALLFQPWDDAWLVRYNKQPCIPNSPWAAFCQGSGWGDEEATVVCREQGYSYGTSDFLPAYASATGYSHIECEGTESTLEQCSIGEPSLFCSFVGVVTQCHNGPLNDDNNDSTSDGTKGDNNEGYESDDDSPDNEDRDADREDNGTDNEQESDNAENPDSIGSENQNDSVAASKESPAGVTAGVVIAAIVVVVLVTVVVILVVVLIWRKRRTQILPATDGKASPHSASETMDNEPELQLGADMDNPVYGPAGVERSPPTHTVGEPEHKFINPLYHLVQGHALQERAGSLSEHEYATLKTPYTAIDRVMEGREKPL